MNKVRLVAGIGGAVFGALGVWALAAPASFYRDLATFPPYNRHLVHDLGAFQLGIALTLLAAIRWRDAMLVALAGAALRFREVER